MRTIAGRFKGKKLISPKNDIIRPTSDRVRENIFNIIASKINNDFTNMNVLDLFAGTGALGIEALSRGAESVCFVDNGVEACSIIRSHIESFAIAGEVRLLKKDATNLGCLGKFKPFNLIFLDPPYAKGLAKKSLNNALENNWIAPNALIVLEEKAKIDLDFPKNLELYDKRKYGNTSVYFLAN